MNPNQQADVATVLRQMLQQVTGTTAPSADPQQIAASNSALVNVSDDLATDSEEEDDLASVTNCYNQNDQQFYRLMPSGEWVRLSHSSFERHLVAEGYSPFPAKGTPMSDVCYKIVDIQSRHYVHFVSNIAGHRKGISVQGDTRILVPSEAKFIKPAPGNWDMLRGILERMFGPAQLVYVYGWLQVALGMFDSRTWMAGQVLAVCGKRNSGKNLFTWIVEKLFGGRLPGKPYSYMTGGTSFNSDLVKAELLTIEDEISSSTYSTRKNFGDRIKDIAANWNIRLHRKNAEAITVTPLQRLVISANDDQESLQIFPPINHGVGDKIILLLVEKHPLPMPVNKGPARVAFQNALLAELPAFVDFLKSWEIPTHLICDRFGITHYHHPDLLAHLKQACPEQRLLELIDEVVFSIAKARPSWTGKAVELERELRASKNPQIVHEVATLLPARESCGRYLARLSDEIPDRITKRSGGGGICKYTIQAPESSSIEDEPETFDELPLPSHSASPESLAKIEVLRQRIRAREAEKAAS